MSLTIGPSPGLPLTRPASAEPVDATERAEPAPQESYDSVQFTRDYALTSYVTHGCALGTASLAATFGAPKLAFLAATVGVGAGLMTTGALVAGVVARYSADQSDDGFLAKSARAVSSLAKELVQPKNSTELLLNAGLVLTCATSALTVAQLVM